MRAPFHVTKFLLRALSTVLMSRAASYPDGERSNPRALAV